nr:tumor necrosis factor ligand superfamily member 4 isoform X2 [Pan troglodytes]
MPHFHFFCEVKWYNNSYCQYPKYFSLLSLHICWVPYGELRETYLATKRDNSFLNSFSPAALCCPVQCQPHMMYSVNICQFELYVISNFIIYFISLFILVVKGTWCLLIEYSYFSSSEASHDLKERNNLQGLFTSIHLFIRGKIMYGRNVKWKERRQGYPSASFLIVKMERVQPLEENVGNAARPRFERNKLLLVASVIQGLGLLLCFTYICLHFSALQVSHRYPRIQSIKVQFTGHKTPVPEKSLPIPRRKKCMLREAKKDPDRSCVEI